MNTTTLDPGRTPNAGPSAPKVRMLFVDDEPAVLGILRAGMRTMANEWDMHFAENGEAALASIRQQPFDVVVSDMRMPGMSGIQLLNQVVQLHPKTVRIILSGYSDLQDVISSVGLAHQFLHKPCSLIDLRNSLKHIAELNRRLPQGELLTLAARLNHVPSIPDLYLEMSEALQSSAVSAQRIADIVARDPALTAKLLQLSNSAFFGFNRTVNSIEEAVQFLGVGVIQSLALAIPLFSAFDRSKCPAFSIEQVWNHSVQVGALAQWLAKRNLHDPSQVEQSLAAGVLHDIGQLIFAGGLPKEYSDVLASARAEGKPIGQAEQEKFQTTHAELGGYLLAIWGLPLPLVEAVAYHHNPERSSAGAFDLIGVIHVANALEHELNPHSDFPASPFNMDYLRRLGLAGQLEKWREDLRSEAGPSSM